MSFLLGENKKLQTSHALYLSYLLVLLIAPKKTLTEGGSSVNFAIVVLFIWLVYYILKFKGLNLKKNLPINLFLLFSFGSLLSSLFTFIPLVIVNATQFFLYTCLVVLLFNKYFSEVSLANDFKTIVRITNFIGILYSCGSIISVFIGPIYPFQVGDNMRIWGGLFIQQGVGFGVNQNSVGGILVLFVAFCILFVNSKYKRFYIFVYVLAIISTISRSAYLCLIFGWLVYKLILTAGDIQRGSFRIKLKTIRNIFLLLVVITISLVYFFRAYNDYYEALKIGFNLSNDNIGDKEGGRIDQWVNGISIWRKSNILEQFIGKGFKNSSEIIEGKYISAHNLYIQYLLDMGLVGLILFLSSIGFFFVNVLNKINLRKNNTVYLYCIFSLTALLIHNMTETFLYGVEYITFYIFILTLYSYPKLISNANE